MEVTPFRFTARGGLGAVIFAMTMAAFQGPSYAQTQPKTSAPGATVEEARVHYDRGIQAYDEGAYDTALIELRRAYDLAPSPKMLYNIGRVSLELNDYVSALKAFESYLADMGNLVPARRRQEVEKLIEKAKVRVARVLIKSNVNGADVTVDDVLVASTPLSAALSVNAGRRRISVIKSGRIPMTKVLDLEGAAAAEVTFDLPEPVVLAPVPTVAAAAKTTHTPQSTTAPHDTTANAKASSGRSHLWLGWAAAGALAAGATVTGILSLSASRELDDKRHELGESPAAARANIDSSRSRVTTLAAVTDVVGLAALVTGGACLYLTIRGKEVTPGSSRETGLVQIHPGLGALHVTGQF